MRKIAIVVVSASLLSSPLLADDSLDEPSASGPGPRPSSVSFSPPTFMKGDVANLGRHLRKTLDPTAKCVADHGGMEAEVGELEIQFLVRSRGRAEGVEVLSSKGVGGAAASCVRKMLKNRWVGLPSEDPVGVTFHYRLQR